MKYVLMRAPSSRPRGLASAHRAHLGGVLVEAFWAPSVITPRYAVSGAEVRDDA